MRQQLLNLASLLRRQPRQYILEVGVWIMPIHPCRLDQAHDRRRPLAAAQCPCEEPVRTTERPRPDLVLDRIVVDGGSTPFPRTVLKGLKTSSLAGRLYDAFVGYETVRCSRIDPLLPHRESDRIDGQHVPV